MRPFLVFGCEAAGIFRKMAALQPIKDKSDVLAGRPVGAGKLKGSLLRSGPYENNHPKKANSRSVGGDHKAHLKGVFIFHRKSVVGSGVK